MIPINKSIKNNLLFVSSFSLSSAEVHFHKGEDSFSTYNKELLPLYILHPYLYKNIKPIASTTSKLFVNYFLTSSAGENIYFYNNYDNPEYVEEYGSYGSSKYSEFFDKFLSIGSKYSFSYRYDIFSFYIFSKCGVLYDKKGILAMLTIKKSYLKNDGREIDGSNILKVDGGSQKYISEINKEAFVLLISNDFINIDSYKNVYKKFYKEVVEKIRKYDIEVRFVKHGAIEKLIYSDEDIYPTFDTIEERNSFIENLNNIMNDERDSLSAMLTETVIARLPSDNTEDEL